MDTTQSFAAVQEAKQLQNRLSTFMKLFEVGSQLQRSGIHKLRGIKPMTLFQVIFVLPFAGCNFNQGIGQNQSLGFRKDCAYEFLKNPHANWRNLLLGVATTLTRFLELLTSEKREKVLIIDDTLYDRSRSKLVELLAWVYDHVSGRTVKGFRLLTLGWSDGASFVPLDFVLCSSANADKRVQEALKPLDKRCCGARRRAEAMVKSTEHLEALVRRAQSRGIRADYLLMDSWFGFPSILTKLGGLLPVICRVKNMPNVFYSFGRRSWSLSRLYGQLKKRPGKARVQATAVVSTQLGQQVRLVFVRGQKKGQWVALLSTNPELAPEEIARIYGKRWDIEVFFKMEKQYLGLERELAGRDFDGLLGHITVVMLRYMFLAFEQRCHDDPRTLGTLFHACCDEQRDLTLQEALFRLLTLAVEHVRSLGLLAEDAALALVDALMSHAVALLKSGQGRICINQMISTC